MKKKIIAVVLLLCCALVLFTACAPKEKTFTKAGMSITLTDEFYEKTIVSQTAYCKGHK